MVRSLDEVQFGNAGRKGNISKDDFIKHSRDKKLINEKTETEITSFKIMAALNEIKKIFTNLMKNMEETSRDSALFKAEINKNIASISKTTTISQAEVSKNIASIPKMVAILKTPHEPRSNPVGAVWEVRFERTDFGNIISPFTIRRVV